MKLREVYSRVADLAEQFGSPRALLEAACAGMRKLRGESIPTEAAELLLNSPLAPILYRDDALGQIYQALNAPSLERAYRATARAGRKFCDDEIPRVTQLFTPRFVVEFLLQNTLDRIGASKLAREIRILDPACGTMNFGLVAIEMLEAMYRRELARLGPSRASVTSVNQIPRSILQHNLFGIDIDPAALELAAQTLSMKLRMPVEQCRTNLWRADALFDSGIDARCIGAFDVVVTNPPYLSARNLDPRRVAQIKRKYPASWRDAYACFIERSLQFATDGGRVGILAMQSFMFTGAFQKLREKLAQQAAIEQIAHFGPGLFNIGNPGTLQTVAIVLRKEPDVAKRENSQVNALRLIEAQDKQAAMGDSCPRFRVRQRDLLSSSRSAWTYWLTPRIREIFVNFPKLREIAEPRQGLATTDNARFVRYWWEIEPTRPDAPCRASRDTWFPYVKSGRFRRWFESPRYRVNWADDGRQIKQSIIERYPYLKGRWEWVAKNSQFYRKAGVTYSYLTSGAFSARLMSEGAIFDVAGSAIFPQDPLTMLAILNSSIASELLQAVNPTVNFQVGDLAALPVPCERDETLHELAARAIHVQRSLDACDETSPDFKMPAPWDDDGHTRQLTELASLEQQIDREVANRYRIEQAHPKPAHGSTNRQDLGRRWVSFAIGTLLGRFGHDREHPRLALVSAAPLVLQRLAMLVGADAARQIDETVGGIDRFVAGAFYSWHVKLYRSRPVYWALRNDRAIGLCLHDFATPEVICEFAELPDGWRRAVDDGVLVNLAPLADAVADAALSRKLRAVRVDLERGRYCWASQARVQSSIE